VKSYRYLEQSFKEFSEQVSHYESIESGLGQRFAKSVETVLHFACMFPKSGSPKARGTRRVITKGFPFSVIYFETESELKVIAVAHFKRKPNYWKSRVNQN
jgi:toxin ParE1/3/4